MNYRENRINVPAWSIQMIAVFIGPRIKGHVLFTENATDGRVEIHVDIHGLKKNARHGFHIHEYGDLSDGCESMCAHFNPLGKKHGGPNSQERHVGDLGNLITDNNGVARYTFSDHQIRLRGYKYNILGRGLIIHEDPDDLGLGGDKTSLVTGNAGKRIACAVIGYARPTPK
jgi:Cu-Zn family superoxide dismutase